MPNWLNYKGLEVPNATPADEAGLMLKNDLMTLADRVGPSDYTAVVNPTPTDDASLGFTLGSFWINTVTNEWFVSTNNTVGAAVWLALPIFTGNGVVQIDQGGNARGTGAVDFQKSRSANSQVASGARSFVAGGEK